MLRLLAMKSPPFFMQYKIEFPQTWPRWKRIYYSTRTSKPITTIPMTIGLCASCAAVHLAWTFSEPKRFNMMTRKWENQALLASEDIYKHFTCSMRGLENGYWHTLVTCHFSHITIQHLLFNVVVIYMAGRTGLLK
eukprot:GHVL01014569.1.p1 GENE.GHVL01014569.1~~GHVL01014569.1.p1  ORF type:complete len:136 (+),score=12.73 GHVL01014569.1:26-433(+)